MDWNGNNLRLPPFVPRPTENCFSFLYNNYDHQFPVLEMKQGTTTTTTTTTTEDQIMLPMDRNMNGAMNNFGHHHDPKKKRLSNEQLELLENSFQEEIKLDPDRKMKLAKELGLQPRQIAVWFQNRRARWKAKQLERLYDALKQEYNSVSRDKQKLQQEVLALRAILKEQVGKKQVSTEISGEETVESTSIPMSSERPRPRTDSLLQIAECNYPLNFDDYNNTVMAPPPYWPSCP